MKQRNISSLPPLVTAPSWAANHSVDIGTLCIVRNHTVLLNHKFGDIKAVLSTVPRPARITLQAIPTATIEVHLHTLRNELQEMKYPTELTSWMNSVRSLAARAVAIFSESLGILQQLCDLDPTRDAYREGLDTLRQKIAQVSDAIDELLHQIDAYLGSEESARAFPIDSFDESGQGTAEWYRGWHSGLREAEALIRDALHPYGEVGIQDERHLAEEIVGRVVDMLQERIKAAASPLEAQPF